MNELILSPNKTTAGNLRGLIAPIDTTLGTVPGGRVAFKGAAEGTVAFAIPDLLNRFLEDVAQHALLSVLAGAAVAKRGKTAGEHISTGCNVGQIIRAPAAGPGPGAEIARDALEGRSGSGGSKPNAILLACLLGLANQRQFPGSCAMKKRLLRSSQAPLEIDQAL